MHGLNEAEARLRDRARELAREAAAQAAQPALAGEAIARLEAQLGVARILVQRIGPALPAGLIPPQAGALIAQAEQALDRADAAQSHDERARQERLYGEIGARIAELRATRRDIAHQLQVLEQTLDDSATTQPDR